jgi:phosphoribosylformylglycinamidine (FGAM) synthase-like amidotransferase family enzyme
MMPHPENAMEPLHSSTDGAVLFESLIKSLAA